MRRSSWMVTLFLAVAAALGVVACFDPLEPACAFACGATLACPGGYKCGLDNLCHRNDEMGLCTLTPPGDGGDASDAGAD